MNTKIYAEVLEPEALAQFNKAMSLDCNVQGALMPDAHTGYTLPIGAVIKSHNRIFPAYVGYDIGCGMTAIRTDIKQIELLPHLAVLKTLILATIPLGRGTHNLPRTLTAYPTASSVATEVFSNLAPFQLGTLGGGNHFIEVGYDRDDYINIIIHSGSRGVGKKIAEHYMQLAAISSIDTQAYKDEFDNTPKNLVWCQHALKQGPEALVKYTAARDSYVQKQTSKNLNYEGHYGFDLQSAEGQAYLTDLSAALAFALENRATMAAVILMNLETILSREVATDRCINRNHNHAEVIADYVIHRKGATHAEAGMLGVIPGNMRDGSFIVVGKGNPDSMSSSSHGAGRVLSRSKAKATLSLDDFHSEMSHITTNHTDDTLDEAPSAYKNIFEVMELQKNLVEVIDHVKPLLNIKG